MYTYTYVHTQLRTPVKIRLIIIAALVTHFVDSARNPVLEATEITVSRKRLRTHGGGSCSYSSQEGHEMAAAMPGSEKQIPAPLWGGDGDWQRLRPNLLTCLSADSAQLPDTFLTVPAAFWRDAEFVCPKTEDNVLVHGGTRNVSQEHQASSFVACAKHARSTKMPVSSSRPYSGPVPALSLCWPRSVVEARIASDMSEATSLSMCSAACCASNTCIVPSSMESGVPAVSALSAPATGGRRSGRQSSWQDRLGARPGL